MKDFIGLFCVLLIMCIFLRPCLKKKSNRKFYKGVKCTIKGVDQNGKPTKIVLQKKAKFQYGKIEC